MDTAVRLLAQYDSHLCDEVGVSYENANNRNMVLHYRDGGLHCIFELNRCCNPLPLMVPMDGKLKPANGKKN